MDRIVFALCSVWVWITRQRRMEVYAEAAKTLELAHAYLLRDFASHASMRERGTLVPSQVEALSLLERHSTMTYMAVTRFSSLRWCLRFVAEELSRLTPAPAFPAASRPIRLATIRVRYRLPRMIELPVFARLLRSETSGTVWATHSIEPAEQQPPLKAA